MVCISLNFTLMLPLVLLASPLLLSFLGDSSSPLNLLHLCLQLPLFFLLDDEMSPTALTLRRERSGDAQGRRRWREPSRNSGRGAWARRPFSGRRKRGETNCVFSLIRQRPCFELVVVIWLMLLQKFNYLFAESMIYL